MYMYYGDLLAVAVKFSRKKVYAFASLAILLLSPNDKRQTLIITSANSKFIFWGICGFFISSFGNTVYYKSRSLNGGTRHLEIR